MKLDYDNFILRSEWILVKCNAVHFRAEHEEPRCVKASKVYKSTSFHLLGSHHGQEVPSLQSHQETPEHTDKQGSYVTRGELRLYLGHIVIF